jgi:hypothetical protein
LPTSDPSLNPRRAGADVAGMTEERRCIASHAAESDYAPLARMLLWKLGYELRPPEEAPEPALHVVTEERLPELASASAPIILLTRQRRKRIQDGRIVGVVRRPAGPHPLFQLFQSALEPQPRSVLRVPTESLRAWGRSEDDQWELSVESLSENGCLVAGAKLPVLDTFLQLEIELPWGARVRAPAVAAYELGEDIGLVFHGITLEAQQCIRKAVVQLLERL